MSGKVLNWAARVQAGDLTAKAVLLILAEAANDGAETIIGQDTIAERLETSRETVNRAMKRLEVLGLVTRTRRKREDGYRTSDLVKLTLCDPASRDFPSRDEFSRDFNAGSYVTQDHSLTLNINPQTKDTSSTIETPPRKATKRINYDPAFEAIFVVYPHFQGRTDKSAAYRVWQGLSPNDQAALPVAVDGFATSPQASKDEGQFVPAFERWLRKGQWRDFVSTIRADQPGPGIDWEARMAAYKKSDAWPASWGEKPGRDGCQVPSDLLARHGFGPACVPALRVIEGGAA